MTINSDEKREFWRLSLLNTLLLLSVPLASLVDTAVLGQENKIAIQGGVSLASTVFDYVFWAFGFLRMATTGLVAQAYGRNDETGADVALLRSATIGLLAGITLLLFAHPIAEFSLPLMNPSADAKLAARAYFDMRICGAPFVLTKYALLGWLIGRGKSGWALAVAITSNCLNIVFDFWFVVKLGWGAEGAGLATALGHAAGTLVALAASYRALVRAISNWRAAMHWRSMLENIILNVHIIVRTLALVSTFALFRRHLSGISDVDLDASTIIDALVRLCAYLVDGIAFAMETLAGRKWGKRDSEGLRALTRYALGQALLFAVLTLSLLFVFAKPIITAMNKHQVVVETAMTLRWWLIPIVLIGTPSWVLDGLYLGISKGKVLQYTMLISFSFFAALLFVLPHQTQYAWAALTGFFVVRSSSLSVAFQRLAYDDK